MPESYEKTFQKGFMAALAEQLRTALPEKEQSICEDIEAATSELMEQNQTFIKDALSHCHLAMTSLFLAAYQALQERIPDKSSVLKMLRVAFFEGQKWREAKEYFRSLLIGLPDSFTSLVEMSKAKEIQQYGKTFSFEHERDDDNAYFLTVTNCFYHNFFLFHGVTELTPIFCDWDNIWGDELKDGKFGTIFERPTTMGYGDDKCRFQFTRVKIG
jgi:hypothetical protein